MGRAGTRRLEFSTIFNVRDLAGIKTASGTIVPRRILRAGDTMFLADDEADALVAYGVRRVLDLRMPVERPELTDPFAQSDRVRYRSIPMFDDQTLGRQETEAGRIVDFLVRQHARMLDDAAGMRAILEFLAEAKPDECVLIHCALGQDRTGIVCMLIEGLCGASRETIVRDFAYSFDPDEIVDGLVDGWDPDAPLPRFDGTEARIAAMHVLLDTIDRRYGGIESMVRSWGVETSTIQAIVDHATK